MSYLDTDYMISTYLVYCTIHKAINFHLNRFCKNNRIFDKIPICIFLFTKCTMYQFLICMFIYHPSQNPIQTPNRANLLFDVWFGYQIPRDPLQIRKKHARCLISFVISNKLDTQRIELTAMSNNRYKNKYG